MEGKKKRSLEWPPKRATSQIKDKASHQSPPRTTRTRTPFGYWMWRWQCCFFFIPQQLLCRISSHWLGDLISAYQGLLLFRVSMDMIWPLGIETKWTNTTSKCHLGALWKASSHYWSNDLRTLGRRFRGASAVSHQTLGMDCKKQVPPMAPRPWVWSGSWRRPSFRLFKSWAYHSLRIQICLLS